MAISVLDQLGCIVASSTFLLARTFCRIKVFVGNNDDDYEIKHAPRSDFVEVLDMNLDMLMSFNAPLFVTCVIKGILAGKNY